MGSDMQTQLEIFLCHRMIYITAENLLQFTIS